jgi:hypothetical protein
MFPLVSSQMQDSSLYFGMLATPLGYNNSRRDRILRTKEVVIPTISGLVSFAARQVDHWFSRPWIVAAVSRILYAERFVTRCR